MIVLTVSNSPHPGLDCLQYSVKKNQLELRVLGIGSKIPIGHGKGFGLKLDLLKKELELLPPLMPILFVDAYDVVLQPIGPHTLMKWLSENPEKVLFAGEKEKWPNKDLMYPIPLQWPFPYLNSGCIFGTCARILSLLQRPYTMKTDDQLYYSEQIESDTIVIDHKGEHMACLVNVDEIQWVGNYQIEGQIPFVLHFNNGMTRIFKYASMVSQLYPDLSTKAMQVYKKELFSVAKTYLRYIGIILACLFFFSVKSSIFNA